MKKNFLLFSFIFQCYLFPLFFSKIIPLTDIQVRNVSFTWNGGSPTCSVRMTFFLSSQLNLLHY